MLLGRNIVLSTHGGEYSRKWRSKEAIQSRHIWPNLGALRAFVMHNPLQDLFNRLTSSITYYNNIDIWHFIYCFKVSHQLKLMISYDASQGNISVSKSSARICIHQRANSAIVADTQWFSYLLQVTDSLALQLLVQGRCKASCDFKER